MSVEVLISFQVRIMSGQCSNSLHFLKMFLHLANWLRFSSFLNHKLILDFVSILNQILKNRLLNQ